MQAVDFKAVAYTDINQLFFATGNYTFLMRNKVQMAAGSLTLSANVCFLKLLMPEHLTDFNSMPLCFLMHDICIK